jgi:hypothetical protein
MEGNTMFSDKFAIAIQKDLTKILTTMATKDDIRQIREELATKATKEDIRGLRNEIFQEINGIRGRVDRVEEKVGIKPVRV